LVVGNCCTTQDVAETANLSRAWSGVGALTTEDGVGQTSPVAFDSELAARVRAVIGERPGLTERKMFGGVAWMLEGNLACAVVGDELLVRMGADHASSLPAK
jgi:hypothetical protein